MRNKKILGARGTITPQQFDLVYLNDFLHSKDFANVVLSPALNLLSDNDYHAMAEAYINFFLECENRIKKGKVEEIRNNQVFMSQLSAIHRANVRNKVCGAASNLYAIDINGDIYPCQRFVGNKEMSLGNVFYNDNKQKYFLKKSTLDNFEKCKTCWIRNLCVGGCLHDNYSMTGDMNATHDLYCKYKQSITEEAINIYLRLSDEEVIEFFGE